MRGSSQGGLQGRHVGGSELVECPRRASGQFAHGGGGHGQGAAGYLARERGDIVGEPRREATGLQRGSELSRRQRDVPDRPPERGRQLFRDVGAGERHRFDWPSPVLGAGHGVDIPFAFDTLATPGLAPRLGEDPPQSVADVFHAVWTEFIAKGEPGWDPYDTATRTTALITDTIRLASDPGGDERAVWEGLR
jgi:para-nitrobenzyl esterase